MEPETIERAGWVFWTGAAVICAVLGIAAYRIGPEVIELLKRDAQWRRVKREQQRKPRVFGIR